MTNITKSDYDEALNDIFEGKIGEQYTRKEAERLCYFFYDDDGDFIVDSDDGIACHVFKSDDEYVAWKYSDNMDKDLHSLDFTKTASLGLMGELTECGVISIDYGEFSVTFQAEEDEFDGAIFQTGCKLIIPNEDDGTYKAKTNIAKLFGHKLYYKFSDISSLRNFIVYAKYKKHEPYFDFVQSVKDARGQIIPKVQSGWKLKEAAYYLTNGSYTTDANLYKQRNYSEYYIGSFEKTESYYDSTSAFRLVSNINEAETSYNDHYYMQFNSADTDFRTYRMRLAFEADF